MNDKNNAIINSGKVQADQDHAYMMSLKYPVLFIKYGQKSVPLHRHPLIEIVYIMSGSGTQFINGQKYDCKRGDLLFFNVNDTHCVTSPGAGVDTMHLMVRADCLCASPIPDQTAADILTLTSFREFQEEVSQFLPRVTFQENEQEEIEFIFQIMHREYLEKKTGFEQVLNSYLRIVISKILRKISDNNHLDVGTSIETISPEILDFIQENYSRRITLQELARMSFYNPSYFGQVFKKCFGLTPIEYINKLRVEESALLLKRSKDPVEQICNSVGFRDTKQYYRLFKRYMGTSPAKYRNIP